MTKHRRPPRRLRAQLPNGRSLAGVPVVAVGDEIVIREGSTLWRSESGQGVIDFAAEALKNRTLPFVPRVSETEADRSEREAEDWYELACELEAATPDQAQKAYVRALDLDPGHAGARVNLGRLLHEGGHPLAAAHHYQLALATRPDDPIAAFNLGVALEDLERNREAIAAYELALAADPSTADAHYNLAGLYEKEGEEAAAIRHLKAYRKLTQGR